jgi:hypothetical protein
MYLKKRTTGCEGLCFGEMNFLSLRGTQGFIGRELNLSWDKTEIGIYSIYL